MVTRRTVDLLPEIFRTDTNRKFLSATLDQLVQEPSLKRTQGYIGRRTGPGVNPADNYVVERTAVRSDYQLEPGVISLLPDTNTVNDAITYPGMIDALALNGAAVDRQDRLFQSEYYTWDPFCDLDKFSNYSQYYWLPQGPDSVDVSSSFVPSTDSFDVTRTDVYEFSGVVGENPVLTLVRGGSYTFDVNQQGHSFWIQAAPGISGTMPSTPNISSRGVLGVSNNGEDTGTVTFNVPLKTAQDFFYGLTDLGTVDLATELKFNQINNVYVSAFLSQYPNGIDGITNLENRTVIFLNREEDAEAGGWQITTQFDPLLRDNGTTIITNGLPGSYDSLPFDQTTDITSQAQRYSVWQIQYLYDDDGEPYMRLGSVLPVPNLSKLRVSFGAEYSSTQWYRNAEGYFEEIPLLTAVLDTLYYQDGTNPDIFGQIRLIDDGDNYALDIDEIIGARNYTSPNGVTFTNGLKVQFRGSLLPASYQNQEFYVEGVGTGPGVDARVGFIDGEAYFGPFHVHLGQKMTGASHSDTQHQFIYDTVAESLANPGAAGPVDAPLPAQAENFESNIGTGIKLLPVTDFITPETYTESETIPYDSTPYDSTNYDESLDAPEVPDYITINRASRDRNAWSRSNRWFHIDVIEYTAQLNNTVAVYNNNFRAKRPIIEFRANLDLFNFGTQAKTPINIIDFDSTDAFSNINGQTGYSTDGYTLVDGSLVIFANDQDLAVRNRIYRVEFINPDGDINSPPVINLVLATNGVALAKQTVVCQSGNTTQGISFWYDGLQWIRAQQKTGVNQPPLFDVFDARAFSFGDSTVYPGTNFKGSRLFGYATSDTAMIDEVLGFSLRYLNINNVGDIQFNNYLYTDTFNYVKDTVGQTVMIGTGFVHQSLDRVSFSNQIGWQIAAGENRSRQQFRFIYNNQNLILDVPVDTASVFPPLQIFVQGQFLDTDRYSYVINGLNTVVTLLDPPEVGTVIEVQALSNVASQVGFYEIPLNLENNALNQNSANFTLGIIRTHYESICYNLRNLQGDVNGANNTRDLGDILIYGDNIVQHSAPLVLSGLFLRDPEYRIFESLSFNSQEYQKYKARLLDLAAQGNFINSTATQILDTVMQEISLGRSDINPFYWSDMIASGDTYTETSYTYSVISTPVFDTLQTYNFDSANYLGLLVYVNGTILTLGYDYTVGPGPVVTITSALAVNDVITIREYPTTYGSYVPNTPTKLGLFPAYRPEIYLDSTYVSPTQVIRGHDGSITRAYGDIRDDILLEFETRIFNNLKIADAVPLGLAAVMPGQFRETDYSLEEINQILSVDFLNWVGWNKLDYNTQTYLSSNEFTYNYSQSGDKLSGDALLGNWRGIYRYFYDTEEPQMRPWEMLGFSQEPDWWADTYGPAPYTSGNLVLWDDLAAGLVNDPAGAYVLPQYRRPGLQNVIPTNSEGALLPPLDTVVGNYDVTSFRRSWTFGDVGPVEASWRNSSAWPFAVMRLLALTKPAKFFSLFVDRDRYRFDASLAQYLWDQRYRLDAQLIDPIYGDGVSKASYIDWIIDYNQQLGSNSNRALTRSLKNLDVRLCWRTGAFTDKKYLKLFSERSTPNSLNTSLLLPDESYQILLYKNQPFARVIYSSVIVQSTDDGYMVMGYSGSFPYFPILTSRANGLTTEIEAGGVSVRVPIEYSNQVVNVPYGYVFTTRTAVCDFLISYGKLLEAQGMTFDTQENGYVMDWMQMAQEFLYWSTQGWVTGSLINLNPGATKISVTRADAVADSLVPTRLDNIVLNQNRQPMPIQDLVVNRLDNTFSINSVDNNTINYFKLEFTAYEHLIVLDNVSIFADLIYQPVTGARQSRLLVSGWLSADWNGTVNAPGFVLNQNNIAQWQPNRTYTKGEIVLFKDEYWAASTIIQPASEFNYASWLRSDFDEVMQGLLPNAANSSDQLANVYSIYSANLERENDLFSYGLIGFRPREYMQALNLDDVSQVNLYQQFLGTKGTLRSAEIFSLADLGKESAEYNIYEYWALLKAQYGATANRNYFELLLNQALLPSDPSLVQIVEPQQTSQADQAVLTENVWKSTFPVTTPNILPTTTEIDPERALPTAGYVNLDDVDITLFSLDNPAALSVQLDDIGIGTTIWVAKANPYDWNVYACEKVPGDIIQISDNLDGRSEVLFTREHGLAVDDYLIIRFFDALIDGVYRVRAVPDIFSVLIDYTFTGDQTSIQSTGVGFTLQTARVSQPSDISTLPFVNDLLPGAKAWVDNNGDALWEVVEKTNPFEILPRLQPLFNDEGARFGAAVAQGFQNLTALIGAPGFNPDNLADTPGAVYFYTRTDANTYEESIILTLDAANVVGFGSVIDLGDQSWAIVGAPQSNANQGYAHTLYRAPGSDGIEQRQLLVAPDQDFGQGEFGAAVTVSQNERWMYVAAPGHNKVYAYTRVDTQAQLVSYITDGVRFSYNWSSAISIDTNQPNQLVVTLDNIVQEYNVDWQLVGSDVSLNSVPTAGKILRIARRSIYELDQAKYENIAQTSTSGSGLGATFTVNVVRGVYTAVVTNAGTDYDVGDTIVIAGTDIGGASPANDLTLTVTTTNNLVQGQLVAGLVNFSVNSLDGLEIGQSINKVSGDGVFDSGSVISNLIAPNTVVLNSPPTDSGFVVFFTSPGGVSEFTQSGSGISNTAVFALDPFLATAKNIFSFTVTVNGELYRPFMDYDFNSDSSLQDFDIVFNTLPPAGASITVSAQSYFQFVDTLPTPAGLANDARFGASISTTTTGRQIIVGCPATLTDTGRSYVFDRNVEAFEITAASTSAEFTTQQNFYEPISVAVNGQYLLIDELNIGGEYAVTGANTVEVTAALAPGDLVEVETNYFSLIQTIDSSVPQAGAQFGYVVDHCINDCSLYVGAPFYSDNTNTELGQVEFFQNQARVYGIIKSTVANATLTPGGSLRLDNFYVTLTAPSVWSSSSAWNKDDYVINSGSIFRALQAVPVGVALDDREYWSAAGWAAFAASVINLAAVPNVLASASADLNFVGDGATKQFAVGDIYSSAESYTALVYVNNELQTSGVDYVYDNDDQIITFTFAPSTSSLIRVISGTLILGLINSAAAPALDKLQVLPGTGTLFDDLGLQVYVHQQNIVSPYPQDYAHFGQAIFISDNTTTLLVGAPGGNLLKPTTFDSDTTVFDAKSTEFVDSVLSSGAVFSYDLLQPANASITNPAQFVFGQEIYDQSVVTLDQYGSALDYTTGTLLIGAPGYDLGDSQANFGSVLQATNPDRRPAWQIIRQQQPVVNIDLLNTVFMYDRVSGAPKQYFDYFDPLQGRILGVVRQNLDYIGTVDPAQYNVGSRNNYGSRWGQIQVGQIWWDVGNTRFIDPNQDDIVYASRRWGQLFPGSTVDVYQWVASAVPPSQYSGPGIVRSTTSYVVSTAINEQGIFSEVYYFWVRSLRTVSREANKTLSIDTIARYIADPKSSGITYIAPINASTVAIYNGLPYISSQDTVIHVEFDQVPNDDAVNLEYQLIPQDRADGFLSPALYRKLLDSFSGADTAGNPVPDPFLSPVEQYGVLVRPRQSMFVNRFLALENYLVAANAVLAQYPVTESRSLSLLNSSEPEPTAASGAWNMRVANFEELTYQDLNQVPLGYKYLVATDVTNNGLWTIYEVVGGADIGSKTLTLLRVQNYDTRLYWKFIDWYLPGYNANQFITSEVPTFAALSAITVPVGSLVKVTANAQGKWEIYVLGANSVYTRVALEDGTVEFDQTVWDYAAGRFGFDSEVFDAQYYDQAPVIETRKIIEAVNQELLIGDLLIERNRLLVLIFNYILSEQQAPEWLSKTSLIDVDHVIRDLVPFQIYRQDNQDFVLRYIQEVKPYHVQIRQFNLIYRGADTYQGTMTDFDVPAYWNASENLFISPVLDNTGTLSTTSSTPSNSEIWQTLPWNQWFQNYLLSVQSVTVVQGGSGYTVAPDVIITGDCTRPAVMVSRINSAGAVVEVTVLDPGEGYVVTPTISFEGTPGTGAVATAVMGNNLVRSINTTIKYDRYQYTSSIKTWQPGVNYDNGELVRYDNRVWEATNDDSTGIQSPTFDPQQWTLVPAGDLSGIDRTQGYYTPGPDEPGLDLSLLISGISYPGVQVQAPTFSQNTGFDVGNFDINPFDNIAFGPEGRPTYDPAILDAIYESEFTDPYLGVLPTSINVDGGEFVDTYSSHAPEELIPGAMFDTLDLRVFTTPGADWADQGHGFPIAAQRIVADSSEPVVNLSANIKYPVAVTVFNATLGDALLLGTDYTVDWVNSTVSLNIQTSNGINQDDVVVIYTMSLGGGNQLYTNSYIGNDIGDRVVIPFQFSLVNEFVIFANGVPVTDFSASALDAYQSLIVFGTTYGANDRITITALGSDPVGDTVSWSLPVTQYWQATGGLSLDLDNSMQGTNPANIIVIRNGRRATPADGVEYFGDGSSLQYFLPQRGGYDPQFVSDNDVSVWIDNVQLINGVDFLVDPYVLGQARSITLTVLPNEGARILISVRTAAQYFVNGNTLTFRPQQGLSPQLGDEIQIITFNDTSEQNILTQVFVGPETQGILISQGYDDTLYDEGNVSFAAGSYDFATGALIETNRFPLDRNITDTSRLLVSLDGKFLFSELDYTIEDGSTLVLSGPPIGAIQTLVVTSFAQRTVPDAMAFRIFQDMRGVQSTYRITDATSTTITVTVAPWDDVIHVADASRLSAPNLEQGIFGLVTINGERISYRERNTVNNTLSGLRRGTAGTGAAGHVAGSQVYDIGLGNYAPLAYQDSVVSYTELGDGTTTTFVATDIVIDPVLDDAVQVFVGGILQLGGYTIASSDPVTVVFSQAPDLGYQVEIRVRQGLSWYQPGTGTASDGVPLQETDTVAARFLRGE